MSTANLSVGIKTESAKATLLELRAWMQKEMRGVVLSLNEDGVRASVQAALSKQKFRISIDGAGVRADVSKALTEAFAASYKLNLDTTGLTAQVRAAVGGGLAVGGVVGSPGGLVTDIKAVIAQTLTPAVDELAKAAAMVARTGGAAAAGGAAGAARRSASSSFSSTDPLTGERTGYRRTLPDPEAVLLQIQARNEVARADKENERLKKEKFAALNANNTLELAQLRRESLAADRDAERKKKDLHAALNSNNNLELMQIRREAAVAERDAERKKKELHAALNAANNLELAQIRREAIAAERESARKKKELHAALNSNNNLELAQMRRESIEADRAAEKKRKDLYAALNASNNLELAQIRREEMEAKKAAARMERDAARARMLELGRIYKQAEFGAGGTYNAIGSRIVGAQALVQQVGAADARGFLGKSSFLVDEIRNLDDYKVKLKAVGDGHKGAGAAAKLSAENHAVVRRALNDTHSAARGLAGSLGMLWVTWGSTAPIVAAAAIGGTLRSVIVTGKDLEFQLKFVAQLTGEATVPLEKFGQAVRGSLVLPVEAAQAMRAMAQNGLDLRESLSALPTILNLATVGEMGLAEAALGATGVMAAFNLQVSDLGRISDVFAKAAAVSNTSVQSMVESMRQASTVGDQYHVSLEETAASLATMAKRNIVGTAAGTAFRNMMVELATPTDAARKSINALGLEFFDGNNQLKGYTEILRIVKERTDQLNEKSKLQFLNAIFNERGAKAINAILADFDVFSKTLDTLNNKSKDFTQTIAQGLAETTQGKMKALMSEFQLSTATAFGSAKNSVDFFLDSLRSLTASKEFKEGIGALASNVVSLSSALVDNAKLLGYLIAAWASYRIASAAAALATSALAIEMKAVAFAVGALSVSWRALTAGLTFGLSLLAPFVVEWILLRKHTDDATEAQLAFNESMRNQNRTLAESSTRLQEENDFLARRNTLIEKGHSLEQANKLAGGTSEVAAARDKLDRVSIDLDNANEQLRLARISRKRSGTDAPGGGATQNFDESQDRQAAIAALEKRRDLILEGFNEAQKAYNTLSKNQQDNDTKRLREEFGNRQRKAEEFNKKFTDWLKGARNKAGPDLTITLEDVRNADSFNDTLQKREAALNNRKENKVAPTAQGRTDAMAETRAVIERLREEEQITKQRIRYSRELDQARYSSDLFGPYISALLAEQRAMRETNQLLKIEQQAVEQLTARKSDPRLQGEADKKNIDTEIAKRKEAVRQLQAQVAHEKDLFQTRAAEKARQQGAKFEDTLRNLGIADAEQLNKLKQQYSVKIIDPADAAAMTAELEVTSRYMREMGQQQQALADARRGVLFFEESIKEATLEETQALLDQLAVADANVVVEQRRLDVLRKRVDEARKSAGQTAKIETQAAQTAGYGWEKFWTDYRNNALSNAKLVGDAMTTTTNRMADGWANFTATGKSGFKSMVRSIVLDLNRMMAAKAMQQLLSLAFNSLTNTGGSDFGGADVGGVGASPYANGGIMTPSGPVALRTYSDGGVAYQPQLALYGEGRRPEAYVPLPDGRSIPVTIQGGAGGGGCVVNTEVHIHGDGQTRVETEATNQRGAQLGKMVEQSVMGIIAREKRPGGLLERVP